MEKPVVFLSHSSKDNFALRELKGVLERDTGGAIAFFLSSDGTSIPFGKNWVAEVEASLTQAKICFVFLSPHSLESSWVYFEAGFTYGKGVKVIPVGMPGIDLSQLPPPLSLLQGFNIHTPESLNNFIAILNREFQTNFKSTFAASDFALLASASGSAGGYFQDIAQVITRVTVKLDFRADILPLIACLLQEKGIQYAGLYQDLNAQTIMSYGVRFNQAMIYRNNKAGGTAVKLQLDECRLEVEIAPAVASTVFPILDELRHKSVPINDGEVLIQFAPEFSCGRSIIDQTAQLVGSEVKILESGGLSFRGTAIRDLKNRWVYLGAPLKFDSPFLHDLAALLWERKVFQVSTDTIA